MPESYTNEAELIGLLVHSKPFCYTFCTLLVKFGWNLYMEGYGVPHYIGVLYPPKAKGLEENKENLGCK